MLRAQHAALDFQGLAKKGFRLRVLAHMIVDGSQITHRPQRVWMLGTQYALLDVQDLAEERLSLRVLALIIVHGGRIIHRLQRVGALGSSQSTNGTAIPDGQSLGLRRLEIMAQCGLFYHPHWR